MREQKITKGMAENRREQGYVKETFRCCKYCKHARGKDTLWCLLGDFPVAHFGYCEIKFLLAPQYKDKDKR